MATTAPRRRLAEQLRQLADEYDRFAATANSAELLSEIEPSPVEKEVYRSSNGDCWYLVREPGSARLQVRHVPNRASGGSTSVISLEDFLAEGHGPQQEALLRMIEDDHRKFEEQ